MPVAAVVNVTALDLTTGNETYTAVLQDSADGVTFVDAGPIVTITAVGVLSVPGFISNRYSRVKATLAGTTPIITYEAWMHPLGAARSLITFPSIGLQRPIEACSNATQTELEK